MKNKHPKLWRLLKRMNRGLALGLAVVLVMTVWLSVSAAKLKKETNALKELTKEYIIELFEVSAAMNGEAVGAPVSDSARAEMRESLNEIVKKYYSDSAAAQLTYKDSSSKVNGVRLVDGLDDWAKSAKMFHIENAEIIETEEMTSGGYVIRNYSFDATQKATKYLEVEYSFEVIATVVTDELGYLNAYPFNQNGGYPEYYSDDKYAGSDGGNFSKGDVCRADMSVMVSGKLIFVREDGEWKLACTRNTYAYVNRTSNVEIVEKRGGEIYG